MVFKFHLGFGITIPSDDGSFCGLWLLVDFSIIQGLAAKQQAAPMNFENAL